MSMTKKTTKGPTQEKAVAICDKPDTENIVPIEKDIANLIYVVREHQIMFDRDLAKLYQVETGQLNRQVKRNIERFPSDFMFQLTKEEMENLKCQNGIASWGGDRHLPYAFTENGVAMLSSVLRSATAIEVNIRIMRAFNVMQHFLANNAHLFRRLSNIEYRQIEIDKRIDEVFERLNANMQPSQGIFYDGQVFDAYAFVSGLIRNTQNHIILFDNYVDDSVLTMMDKRSAGVTAQIYTRNITPKLTLDLQRHNAQYAPIAINEFQNTHDRFLCIDNTVYHIGASLKDLGKKWFAFSRMEIDTDNLLQKM